MKEKPKDPKPLIYQALLFIPVMVMDFRGQPIGMDWAYCDEYALTDFSDFR